MPITRYTASADTTITNAFKFGNRIRATGSNMGMANSSQIFSLYGQASSSAGMFTSVEKSRALVKFPMDEIKADRASSKIPASGSVSFFLNLYNAKTPYTLPKNFTLRVNPVTTPWDEGYGLDMETYVDTGYANWIVASSASSGIVNWASEGGDFASDLEFEDTFPLGTENLSVDITTLVEDWLRTWADTAHIATPTKLTGSDIVVGVAEGFADTTTISYDGLTASYGAPNHDMSPISLASGLAYVYEKSFPALPGERAWKETRLGASDASSDDNLGRSLRTNKSGKTIVAGAPHWDGGGLQRGSAYVFTASSDWRSEGPVGAIVNQAAHLSASDTGNLDWFGISCGISADDTTIAVGAPSPTSVAHPSTVYVFLKSTNWEDAEEDVRLITNQGATSIQDFLGYSCAVSKDGSTIVAGAPGPSPAGWTAGGALNVYQEPAGGWATAVSPVTETAHLTIIKYSSDVSLLGHRIAMSEDGKIIVAGAATVNGNFGSAYVYVRPDTGTWVNATETCVLAPVGVTEAQPNFGTDVAISADGKIIAVGAENDNNASGSVYLFKVDSTDEYITGKTINSIQRLTENITPGEREFGRCVALNNSGTFLSVGEHGTAGLALTGSGFIYEKPTSRENNGVGIRLIESEEDGRMKRSFYIKDFYSRGTEYFYSRPNIEARWDDSKKDDRGDFYLSSSLASAADNLNNLYLYNFVRGKLQNIPAVGTGKILVSLYSGITAPTSAKLELPAGGGVTTTGDLNITGSWVSTGVYSVSFATTSSVSQVPTLLNRFARSSDTSVQYLYDVWHSGSVQYFTGSGISPKSITAASTLPAGDWVTTVTNLKSSYKTTEKPRFRIFTRPQNWSPTIYTVATTAIEPTILRDSYYKIYRVLDSVEAVPYGTGSIKYTQLSYDADGSYFDFDMSLLESGYAYGIKIMSVEDGIEEEHPEIFKFRVE